MNKAEQLKQRIKEKGQQQGMNIRQIATEAGLGVNAVYQITDKQGISCFNLAKIADVLNCTTDELLGR